MNYKNYILTLCSVLLTIVTYSQDLAPLDYEQRLSYTEFETDYYLVDNKDIDQLSMIDKVKLKEIKYEREYDKFINDNAERTTIIKHISTEGIYKDWMTEVEVVLIDKDGISEYTNEGRLVNHIEHTKKYLELNKGLGKNLLPVFTIPSQEELNVLEKNGFEIMDFQNGFIQISFQNGQLTYNEELQFVEQIKKDDDGNVIHSLQSTYMKLPNGELVYERIRESYVEDFQNGIKAEHVFLRLYSNYRVESTYARKPIYGDSQVLKLKSNSDHSKITLEYEVFSTNSNVEIIIYNLNGSVVKRIHTDNSGLNEIDINDLDSGVYIIRLNTSGKTLNEKFIKL